MSVAEIDEQLQNLFDEQLILWTEENELWIEEHKLPYEDPARAEFREKRAVINERQELITKQRTSLSDQRTTAAKLERQRFERPSKSFAGLMSRGLGPLPEPAKIIHPTDKNLAKVRSFRWAALGLMIVAIGVLISLTIFVPWMRTSPATLITGLFTMWFGPVAGSLVAIVAIVLLFMFFPSGITSKRYKGRFLNKAAMFEEQWFRMGAENWTIRQRIYSCFAFGVVHLVNIVYPIASILVVGLVGGVFLFVYLSTFKNTGSTALATLASAKLHASYNRFAFLYLIVALGLTSVYGLITVLMS